MPVHEALRQRITVHYTFFGLSDTEAADYVRHKLVCAGGAETIIDPAALSALHSQSQGNPRVVDNLMSDTLLLGAQMDKKAIDPTPSSPLSAAATLFDTFFYSLTFGLWAFRSRPFSFYRSGQNHQQLRRPQLYLQPSACQIG